MKRLKRILILLMVVITSFSLTGCGNATITESAIITENDHIEMYQLAIRKMILEDNSFGKAVAVNHLYILKNTDDHIGGQEIPNLPSQVLGDVVMEGIETKLSDLAAQIIWVDSFHEVPKSTDGGAAVEDGAMVTLANIRRKSDSEVYVSIGIYFANVAGSSCTYVLGKDDNGWIINQTIICEVA